MKHYNRYNKKIRLLTLKISNSRCTTATTFFAASQAFAYYNIIDLYDLKKTTWTPKQGFAGLTEAINHNGALVVFGHLGLPQYSTCPKALLGGVGAKISSRSIRFWTPEALKPIDDNKALHSIIIIGIQKISNEESDQEYVLFLDPNDPNTPGQKREVYRMSYADLIQRVATQTTTEFTNSALIPEDPDIVYAVSAK